METPEERLTRQFLAYLFTQYPTAKHIQRMAAAVGPAIWKISRATGHAPHLSRIRQLTFTYKGRNFKGRYSHENHGQLELVETAGARDVGLVATIRGLDDAMKLDLKRVLDSYTRQRNGR